MKRRVIFRQSQCPGDILTMTRALADLKATYPDYEIGVRTPCNEIFENNPHVTKIKLDAIGENTVSLTSQDFVANDSYGDIEVYDIGYGDIQISGWNGLHFTDAFRNDIERKLNSNSKMVDKYGKVEIKKTSIRPELYISDQEKSWINQVECEFGWKGPFWLINAGRKHDNELKQYHRWQEVVDLLNAFFDGRVKIVQIGHAAHIHPKLKGVLSLVGKTDTRQLIRLAYWAKGSIGPLSFQFVMSAALDQPAVCVAAGKEGVRWHIYPNIRYLYTNGALFCCSWDGCWKGGVKGECINLVDGVPRCFRIIEPYMIRDAVKMYYDGGVLTF